MAFVKIGDKAPIIDFFDSSLKQKYCPNCGRKLKLLSLAGEENKLVCESCQNEPEELN